MLGWYRLTSKFFFVYFQRVGQHKGHVSWWSTTLWTAWTTCKRRPGRSVNSWLYHILVEENSNWIDTPQCQRPPWSSLGAPTSTPGYRKKVTPRNGRFKSSFVLSIFVLGGFVFTKCNTTTIDPTSFDWYFATMLSYNWLLSGWGAATWRLESISPLLCPSLWTVAQTGLATLYGCHPERRSHSDFKKRKWTPVGHDHFVCLCC